MRLLNSLAIAISMYSKIPVPTVDWNEKNMKYAMCFFPVVGVITGIFQFGIGYALLEYTSCGKFFFAAVMSLIPVLVTGGIHLDGYADTIDAISSYGDREKKLQILKDPHTGVSGISVVSFHPAKNSGLLRTFQDGAQKKRVRIVLIIWACICGGIMLYLGWQQGGAFAAGAAAVIAAALLVFAYYHRMSRKKFGGTTGDLAGYFLQMCELAMLAVIVFAGKII